MILRLCSASLIMVDGDIFTCLEIRHMVSSVSNDLCGNIVLLYQDTFSINEIVTVLYVRHTSNANVLHRNEYVCTLVHVLCRHVTQIQVSTCYSDTSVDREYTIGFKDRTLNETII